MALRDGFVIRRFAVWTAAVVLALATWMAHAADAIPSFSATALTGQAVTKADLVGAPTVLILTPSKKAAIDTRLWVKELHSSLDHYVRVRDVLAIDLPFFMSESDALGRAKGKIPGRYYDQTWLMSSETLESALGVPVSSPKAFVFVLDRQGNIVARVSGNPTDARIGEIRSALRSIR